MDKIEKNGKNWKTYTKFPFILEISQSAPKDPVNLIRFRKMSSDSNKISVTDSNLNKISVKKFRHYFFYW